MRQDTAVLNSQAVYSRSRLPRLVVEQQQGGKEDDKVNDSREGREMNEEGIDRMLTTGKGRKKEGYDINKTEEGGRRKKRRKMKTG